jgi:hypothetical protein
MFWKHSVSGTVPEQAVSVEKKNPTLCGDTGRGFGYRRDAINRISTNELWFYRSITLCVSVPWAVSTRTR